MNSDKLLELFTSVVGLLVVLFGRSAVAWLKKQFVDKGKEAHGSAKPSAVPPPSIKERIPVLPVAVEKESRSVSTKKELEIAPVIEVLEKKAVKLAPKRKERRSKLKSLLSDPANIILADSILNRPYKKF